MTLSEWLWGGVGLLLTVMVLSYLIGDNVFFRFAAHLFVGLTAGYAARLLITQLVLPYLIIPLIYGTWIERLWMGIPLGLILLLLLSQFPRFVGLGRIPLAFLAGLTAAIAIGGAVFGTLLPQSRAVIEAFDPVGWEATPGFKGARIFEAVLMLVGTVGTLSYFHFGKKLHPPKTGMAESDKRPPVFEALAKVGQVMIGITLGALFAGVFSSALVALIDRILFIGQFVTRAIGALR